MDCHKTMGAVHTEQAKADDLIVQLAHDYERSVASAKDVLAQRRKFQQVHERELKFDSELTKEMF